MGGNDSVVSVYGTGRAAPELQVPPRIQDVLSRIKYRDWRIYAQQITSRLTQIRLAFEAPCVNSGCPGTMHCGDRLVSGDATEDEIVRTVLAMILAAQEHEAREHFTYRGARVFDPHQPLVPKSEAMTIITAMDRGQQMEAV